MIVTEQEPYNPLAKTNLGESVADALLRSSIRALKDTVALVGAGVYAIYYTGPFGAYAPIAALNHNDRFEKPIYVGKAVPKGARKGGMTFDAGAGSALRDRLREHARSIEQSENLDVVHFFCRALTVDDIWIPLGENVLIEKFQPLWNRVIDGFGNKTPGKRRADQLRSSWDALHPGRKFVEKLGLGMNPMSADQLSAKIRAFFAGQLPESQMIDAQAEEEAES